MTEEKSCLTHHELAAQFSAFKEMTMLLFDEREKLALERAARIDERIVSMKGQTAIAFASSEKAVEKSEMAQKEYNVRSNEFRSALDDAQKNNVSIARFDDFKKEYEGYKFAQATEIRSLRESRSAGEGRLAGISTAWAIFIAVIGLIGGGGAVGLILKLMGK